MFIKKNKFFIPILLTLVFGVVCFIAVYILMLQPSQAKNLDLYGTYQFNIRDLDHTEYLAVIPPLAGSANKNEGQFQWYNIDKKMLNQGTCKIDKENFITFYVEENSIATIFAVNGKYYFIDDSLEPQEITKISEEPMVSIPLE